MGFFSPAHLLWEKFQLFLERKCKSSFSPSHETSCSEFPAVPWQQTILRTNGNSVSENVSRGLGHAQHSARESELIAGLGAGPGANNPSLSASDILHIVLSEAWCGCVSAAGPVLTTISMTQGPSFLSLSVWPRASHQAVSPVLCLPMFYHPSFSRRFAFKLFFFFKVL